MIDLSDLLVPDGVAVGLTAATKKTLFTQIGGLAGPLLALNPREVADALLAREKAGSTGFGGGVAVPHARIDGLDRIAILVVRLAQRLDFGAPDDVGVDVVVAMLSPSQAGAAHLKALARVARRFRDRRFVEKLRGAGSPDAVYALLTTDETRDAA